VTLYVNSDTQEVCTEAEMREAFTSAENDDIRGSKLRVGEAQRYDRHHPAAVKRY
jgi:hypothetical protein